MVRSLHKTDIEILMETVLAKHKIKAVYNFPVRTKHGYIIDFAIPSKRICIECDGEHYHKLGNSRDRKRNWVLRNMGWKIIRFRGKEIKENIDGCIEKIKVEIEKRKNHTQ